MESFSPSNCCVLPLLYKHDHISTYFFKYSLSATQLYDIIFINNELTHLQFKREFSITLSICLVPFHYFAAI